MYANGYIRIHIYIYIYRGREREREREKRKRKRKREKKLGSSSQAVPRMHYFHCVSVFGCKQSEAQHLMLCVGVGVSASVVGCSLL